MQRRPGISDEGDRVAIGLTERIANGKAQRNICSGNDEVRGERGAHLGDDRRPAGFMRRFEGQGELICSDAGDESSAGLAQSATRFHQQRVPDIEAVPGVDVVEADHVELYDHDRAGACRETPFRSDDESLSVETSCCNVEISGAIEGDLCLARRRHVAKNGEIEQFVADREWSEAEAVPKGRPVLPVVAQGDVDRFGRPDGRCYTGDFRLLPLIALQVATILSERLVPRIARQPFKGRVHVDQRPASCRNPADSHTIGEFLDQRRQDRAEQGVRAGVHAIAERFRHVLHELRELRFLEVFHDPSNGAVACRRAIRGRGRFGTTVSRFRP